MKKMLLLTLALALGFSSYVFAGPSGNPFDATIPYGPGLLGMSPDNIGVLKVSYENDIIFKREIDIDWSSTMPGAVADDSRDSEFKGQYYYGKISYALFDRFEPFVILGACNGVEVKGEWKSTGADFKAKYESDFLWGVGAKVLVYEWEEFGLIIVAQGQYRRTEPKLESFNDDGEDVSIYFSKKGKLEIQEWDAGVVVGKEFQVGENVVLLPYAGLKYADSDLEWDCEVIGVTGKIEFDTENKHKIAPFVGLDVIVTDFLSLNIEGRFVADYALSAGLTVRF